MGMMESEHGGVQGMWVRNELLDYFKETDEVNNRMVGVVQWYKCAQNWTWGNPRKYPTYVGR